MIDTTTVCGLDSRQPFLPNLHTLSFAASGLSQRGRILLAGDGANDSHFRILMADTITIPSPRVFLTAEPVPSESSLKSPKPAQANPELKPKPKQQRKRNPATTKPKFLLENPGDSTGNNGVEKKKQSKSRNGELDVSDRELKTRS